jgi:AcrR family transcriptional regulator
MSSELSTRDRIIRQAASLFASQGVKATTVAQIEAAVGLRAGSGGLHRHFRTKDALVSEVLESQLQRGRQTRESSVSVLRPGPEHLRPYLEAVAMFTLSEANAAREVALIMLREELNYPELIRTHSLENDEIAYGATGLRLKALFAEFGMEIPAEFDLDAFGYMIVAPLILFRLKEWTSGQKVRGLSDERIAAMWARLCEPLLQELMALLPTELPNTSQET